MSFTSPVLFLFAVDLLTNGVDYGFHVFLGRALLPEDFAVVQTVNAVLLIVATTLAMMQPVVGRFVAQAEAASDAPVMTSALDIGHGDSRGVFKLFFSRNALLGLLLAGLVLLLRDPLARWLNLPPPAVTLSAFVLLLVLLRSVVAGTLQGQQRFVAFGLTRSLFALGRFGSAVLLVALGGGALGAVAAWPIAALLSLVGGLGLLGWVVWRPSPSLPPGLWRRGLRLSFWAFLASAAYMGLLSSDLVWVNRHFDGETAGAYATAVLLRRVLLLLPGAVVVIMYPKAVAAVTKGDSPAKLLRRSAAMITVAILIPTLLYFAVGFHIVRLTFGDAYAQAGPLLGWMGLATLGFGIGSIWYSLFMATRPAPFALFALLAAALQIALIGRYHTTLMQVVAVFFLGGWLLAAGGLFLYWIWLRPLLNEGEQRHVNGRS